MICVAAVSSAQGPEPITLHATQGPPLSLRIEGITSNIIRLWYSKDGKFGRKQSMATETMTSNRIALKFESDVKVATVSTDTLVLKIELKTLGVTVLNRADKERIIDGMSIKFASNDASWSLAQSLSGQEHLLGLGEDNRNSGKLDRRGTIRELWAGQQINSGFVTAEFPIPFMLSTGRNGHAYGVFVDNTYRLKYDLGKSHGDQIKLDGAGGEADFYLINGPAPKDVISRYTGITGRPSLPPLWILGYWQSRCVFYNWNDIDGAYEGLRSHGFPVDTLVIDYNWPQFMNNFVWDDRWTVNGVAPGQRVADYAKKGIKIVLSNTGPMLKKDSPTYKPGWDLGVFATDGKGHAVPGGYYGGDILDFTSPKMHSWLWPQLRPRNEEGIAAWWLDLTEPEGEPPQTIYHDGNSDEIHNQFSLRVTESYEGSQLQDHPNLRPFILTRAGSAGIQRHHAALWTGDTSSDYVTLAAHPPEMLNSGISGLNWWTCDTGGFLSGYYNDDQFGAHARLYERWMQFSVFSPITRAHKSGLCMPYEFGPATEQGTRKYLNLRYQLLPYIYSYAYEASQTGLPIVRALPIEFPRDPGSLNASGDQYMFGSELLVAPVLHEGIYNRSVYLPPGIWFDWDDGFEFEGGEAWVINAPQNRIPVLVKAGAIIPMAPEMANTTVGKWDPLTVEVFPHGKSKFVLYQDDGKTFAFKKGAATTTQFNSKLTRSELKFSIRMSNQLFVPKEYLVKFHVNQIPVSVTVDDKVVGLAWSLDRRILSVPLQAGSFGRHMITVILSTAQLPKRVPPILTADKIMTSVGGTGLGKPVPNFFPPTPLPNRVQAVNYDKGGEGLAFHIAKPIVSSVPYRLDNAGLALSDDGGGGYLLQLQNADDWFRYTLDAGNGGYFDLAVRFKGSGKFHIMSDDRNVTGAISLVGGSNWQEVVFPHIYLNPGIESYLLYVDFPGLDLGRLDFLRSTSPPTTYEAEWGHRTGHAATTNGDGTFNGGMKNIGQQTGSATYGVLAPEAGKRILRIRYSNGAANPIPLSLSTNGARPIALSLPVTRGGTWEFLEVELDMVRGANSLSFSWSRDSWDSAIFDSLEVLP